MKPSTKQCSSRTGPRRKNVHEKFMGELYDDLNSQFGKQLKAIKTTLQTQSNLFANGNDLIIRSANLAIKEIDETDSNAIKSLQKNSGSWRLLSVSENIKLFIELIDELVWDGYQSDLGYLIEVIRETNLLNYGAEVEKIRKE